MMNQTPVSRLNSFSLVVGVPTLLSLVAGCCPPGAVPPRADAGIDQTVEEGTLVVLLGGNSADPDGGPLEFAWSQLPGGVEVTISEPFTAEPTFAAPQVSGADIQLEFELTVTNEQGCADSGVVVITVTGSCDPDLCGTLVCNDDNPCTDDSCVDCVCLFEDNTAECDDTFFCTGVESCDNGECLSSGNPCPPNTTCHEDTDSCDPLCTVTSTFDSSNEDWLILNNGARSEPNYIPTGGNPGGHIAANDEMGDITWFFKAPSKYHGDFSAALGSTLTFDLKQSSLSSQFDLHDVRLTGVALSISFDTRSNPGTDWTSYTIRLDETAGWRVGSLDGPAATRSDILTVLADLTDLLIRGEFVSGPDTGALDNVVLNRACN